MKKDGYQAACEGLMKLVGTAAADAGSMMHLARRMENENRPGLSSAVLTPGQSLFYLEDRNSRRSDLDRSARV